MCDIGTFTIEGVQVTFRASYQQLEDSVRILVSFPSNYPKTQLSNRCKDLFSMVAKRGVKSELPPKLLQLHDFDKPFVQIVEACVFPKIAGCQLTADEKQLTRNIGFLVLQKVTMYLRDIFNPDYILILSSAESFPIIHSIEDMYMQMNDDKMRSMDHQMVEKLKRDKANQTLANLYQQRYGFRPLCQVEDGIYLIVDAQTYLDKLKVCQ